MKKKVLLFTGGGRLLDFYSEIFALSFRQNGLDTILQDVYEKPGPELLGSILKGEVAFGLCQNFLGLRYSLDGKRSLWEQTGLRVFLLLFDHPFHFDREWKEVPDDLTVLVMDRGHIPYIRRFYPTVTDVVFLPHAGIESPLPHSPLENRDITILYAGNLSRIEAQGLIPDLSSVTSYDALRACREILSRLTEEPKYTTEETIERYFKEQSIDFSDEELGKEIARLRFLESFAVSYFRELAIARFLEAGMDVTILGRGWEETPFCAHPKLTLLGAVDPEEVLQFMNRAKCVFSTQTWFKDGGHDRIFNGQLAKSMVVTEETPFLRERFPEEKEVLFFSLEELTGLPQRVEEVLSDTEKARAIASCGFESALQNDTWASRFKGLAG
ncbi:MAG: glycosyltransferase family 1 protein [Lachnospiraceae bacterium]|nr:glycosyltransferase family 1 protein [Lachnospiraceae bacterium]